MATSTPGERGQAGIGAIILLVATLLITVSVAGVMFEVTGSLSADTVNMGQRSNERVLTRVVAVTTSGVVGPNDRVHAVELVLRRAEGARDINLSALAVEVRGPGGVDRLTPASGGAVSLAALRDDDSSLQGEAVELDAQGDRARLNVSLRTLADTGANEPLDPGDSLRIRLGVPTGGATVVNVRVPGSIAGERVAL